MLFESDVFSSSFSISSIQQLDIGAGGAFSNVLNWWGIFQPTHIHTVQGPH